MYIALMSHDNKKDLMVQFCSAYAGILSRHNLCATNTTGRLVMAETGLDVHLFLSCQHGGSEQIGEKPGRPGYSFQLSSHKTGGSFDGQPSAVV